MTTHDLSNDPTRARARRDAVVQAELEIEDLKWLMSHRQGRRIASRLLDKTGVFRLSFNTDHALMSFNEGQRNSGLGWLAQITTHCPDHYMEMLKESKE